MVSYWLSVCLTVVFFLFLSIKLGVIVNGVSPNLECALILWRFGFESFMGKFVNFLDGFLKKKNPSFKIAMSGQASSEVYLLVNLFSKLYFTFISSPELCSG